MTRRIHPLPVMALAVAVLMAVTPAGVFAEQAPTASAGADHSAHQAASQPESGASIEALIKTMRASTGDAKISVMADLIERLIAERDKCMSMMAGGKMMPAPAVAPGTPSQ